MKATNVTEELLPTQPECVRCGRPRAQWYSFDAGGHVCNGVGRCAPSDGTTKPAPIGMNELRACWCYDCLDAPEHGIRNPVLSQMVVCPACGNKRCPRATDHRFACHRLER